jgi:DNA polymerase-3 subunit delta
LTVVKNYKADQFLRRLPDEIAIYLLHGSDDGLIRERSRQVVRASLGGDPDPMNLVRLNGDALSQDPGRLSDEANAGAMFGGNRAVWIELQGRDVMPALAPLLADPPRACRIVVQAGNLVKGSPLRTAVEQSEVAAAIECYPDGHQDLIRLIDDEAREARARIEPDVRDHLLQFLGADRQASRAEVQKLFLYAQGKGTVTIADIEEIVSSASPSFASNVVDAAFTGDEKAIERTLEDFFASGGDANALHPALLRQALSLHAARLDTDSGAGDSRVSFRGKGAAGAQSLERQTKLWPLARLDRLLKHLHERAALFRQEPQLAQALVVRLVWTIASMARAGG